MTKNFDLNKTETQMVIEHLRGKGQDYLQLSECILCAPMEYIADTLEELIEKDKQEIRINCHD